MGANANLYLSMDTGSNVFLWVFSWFCGVRDALSPFYVCNCLSEEERAGCFTIVVFLLLLVCAIVSLLCVLVYLPRDGTVDWSVVCYYGIPRARGYKTLSYSTQLSMKFQLLIKTKIPANEEVSCFKYLRFSIFHAKNVGILTFMSRINFVPS